MRIIDLSLPIEEGHVRWAVERTIKGDTTRGDLFQATTLRLPCHGFTHVDARRHFFGDGDTIEATKLDDVVGMARVVDLKDALANEPIDAERLARAAGDVRQGERLLLITAWHRQADYRTEAFWRTAPYLTRDAAEWLRAQQVSLVAYDFPQDYSIRLLLDGDVRPIEEHVTHDVLLRAGVHMVEYLTNTETLKAGPVFFSAAPLNVPGADGAPARVFAIENIRAA